MNKITMEIELTKAEAHLLESAMSGEHRTIEVGPTMWDEYIKAEAFLRRLKLIHGPDGAIAATDLAHQLFIQFGKEIEPEPKERDEEDGTLFLRKD